MVPITPQYLVLAPLTYAVLLYRILPILEEEYFQRRLGRAFVALFGLSLRVEIR